MVIFLNGRDKMEQKDQKKKPGQSFSEETQVRLWMDSFGDCRNLSPFSDQAPIIPYYVLSYMFEYVFELFKKYFHGHNNKLITVELYLEGFNGIKPQGPESFDFHNLNAREL
jgi:hypothetical protein